MNQENKNSNIIAFRVDPYKKQLLQDQATKNNMKVSEYCKSVLLDNLDQNMLLDSQKKLRELIIETVTDANEKQFYKNACQHIQSRNWLWEPFPAELEPGLICYSLLPKEL